jgi:hypothetical protein
MKQGVRGLHLNMTCSMETDRGLMLHLVITHPVVLIIEKITSRLPFSSGLLPLLYASHFSRSKVPQTI